MSTGTKTLLGILSFVAVTLMGVWVYYYMQWILEFVAHAPLYENNPEMVFQNFRPIILTTIALALPGGLISLGLLIYYIILVVNSKTMETGERVVWIITLIIFCPLTFPIFWLMRVRNLPPPGTVVQAPAAPPHGPTYGY